MRVRCKNRTLDYTRFKSLPTPSPAENEKTIDVRVEALVAAHEAAAQPAAPPFPAACCTRGRVRDITGSLAIHPMPLPCSRTPAEPTRPRL